MYLIDDVRLSVENIQAKMVALSKYSYDRLESVENSLEHEWVENDKLLKNYTKEQIESLYIISTLISDIQKNIDRLNHDVVRCSKKIKRTDNVRPDQETTLPATKND